MPSKKTKTTATEYVLEQRLRRSEDAHLATQQKLEQVGRRLTISNGLVQLLLLAYDALRHHGVDYRSLRVYLEEDNPLMDTTPTSEHEAHNRLIRWMGRMTNDINAAVKRKAIREVPKE